MCGITGLINLSGDPVSSVILKKMTDSIAHRGPDGEGHWIEENIGIGHRRLAIIDLSPTGHQPMLSADHRWVLSYNGEIYNYRELRKELETCGYWFRSTSDTEVVLNALTLWGTDALLKFNGMFALALWDRKEKTLLLARDRYGIKPLYYARQGNTFAFGSEQKAITAQPTFQKKINKPALFEYFTFQNIFTDQTLLEDVHLLPAGHYATLTLSNAPDAQLKRQQYWDYRFREPDQPASKQEYLEEDRLFRQAVNRQLVGDVELGSYLSGGMDSGSITAVAAQSFPNLKTFTCGFDLSSASGIELSFDERPKAEAMSARFKTEHYEMVLKAGDMERCMPLLTWHLEEPRVGQSYPNFYASKLAGRFVKVVLSGTGGDEIFGGYPWRYFHTDKAATFDEYVHNYYLYWQRLLDDDERTQLLGRTCSKHDLDRPRELFMEILARRKFASAGLTEQLNSALYLEAKTFLHGLLVVEDKL